MIYGFKKRAKRKENENMTSVEMNRLVFDSGIC